MRALICILTFVMLPNFAGASNLDDARSELAKGTSEAARDHYAAIGPNDDDWDEKLEDSIRWFILQKKPLSAWRITQLARRTSREIPHLAYYEKLAAIQGGACPFGTRIMPWSWELLAQAYEIRFFQRYKSGTGSAPSHSDAADRGRQISTLSDSETPFLRDLKKTRLITNQGCRFDRPSYKDNKLAEEAELTLLRRYIRWVKMHPEDKPADDRSVQIRLLEIAQKHGYKALAKEALEPFSKMSMSDWATLKDPERRFLWGALQAEGLVPPTNIPLGSPEEGIIKGILPTTEAVEASAWLGLIQFDEWPVADKEKLFEHLDALEDLPHHDEIVLRRALLAYAKGAHQDALVFVRRILTDSDSSEVSHTGAVKIIEELLGEYQYDEAMLGAIQSAIPVGFWPRIYRGLLIDHAIRGNVKAYTALKGQLFNTKRTSNFSKFSPELLAIFDSVANRRGNEFSKKVSELYQRRHSDFLLLANDFAQRTAQLAPSEFANIKQYLAEVTRFLRQDVDLGKTPQQLLDLIETLDRGPGGRRSTAEKAVRGGVTNAGVVDIRPIVLLTNPYVWPSPPSLSRRNLLVVPLGVSSREWTID